MDEDRIVRMSLLLLAAILAAMAQARLLIHVHVYPPPATRSKDAQGSENFKEHKFVHKFDLTVPTELLPAAGYTPLATAASLVLRCNTVSVKCLSLYSLSLCCRRDKTVVFMSTSMCMYCWLPFFSYPKLLVAS